MSLLEINHLSASFKDDLILKDITFSLEKGEVLGLAGASGSGKSVLTRSILRLDPYVNYSPSSEITWRKENGVVDLLKLPEKGMEDIRGKEIGMIFQEPKVALNPSFSCGYQIVEVIRRHLIMTQPEAIEKAQHLIEIMGLEPRIYHSYAHQISGGEAQRVMIAMATASTPKLLLADEPTTSLDPKNEAQILEHLMRLKEESGMAILLVTHDWNLLNRVANRVLYLKEGVLSEKPVLPSLRPAPKRVNPSKDKLLSVKGLHYNVKEKNILKGITFQVFEGEVLGIVGNSGSGKTSLARSILSLVNFQKGEVFFERKNIQSINPNDVRSFRKSAQIVFQDPLDALNPRMKISSLLEEPLKVHQLGRNKTERIEKIHSMLEKVMLDKEKLHQYPHELSGGQRQRVCIARALLLQPSLLVLDEPVTSLDYEIRQEILNLLLDLKVEFNLTYVFISHDLDLINFMTNRVIVLNEGCIVEEGETEKVFRSPNHAYTRSLLSPRELIAEVEQKP